MCDERRFDKLVTGGLSAVRRDPVSTGLFTADTDNPLWLRAHNILLPSFSQQAMRDYHPMMLDAASQLMLKWQRLNPGNEVDVAADMTRLTLDTIALCGFGYRFNSFYRQSPHPFVAAMVRTLEELQPGPGPRRSRPGSGSGPPGGSRPTRRPWTSWSTRSSGSRRNPGGGRDLLGYVLDGVDKQ